jgi:ABC-2 type transport system permease protein
MSATTGVLSLVRLILRRDRIALPVWILALVGITYATARAVTTTYNSPAEIASYGENLGSSPATIAMAGPPIGLDTSAGIVVYETSLTVLIGVALMAIFTVVRHTRAEEEAGRTELLASTVLGRHAPLAAASLVSAAAVALVAIGVVGSALAVDLPGSAAWAYGGAVAGLGLVFTGIAGVAAQAMGHARPARGVALAVLGVAFALRAVGDVRESGLSWASPVGWAQQVRIAGEIRWWPLVVAVAAAAVLLVWAAWLVTRRDVGAGIVPPRPGPAAASNRLGTPFGLAWRLQRGSVVGWGVGVFLLGLMFGSLSEEMEGMVEDNPTLAKVFASSGGDIADSLFAVALLFVGLAVAGFAVSSALRLRGEESAGRLEALLAGAVPRSRMMLGTLAVTLAGAVVLVTLGGLGLGLADAAVRGDAGSIPRLIGLGWVQLPAVLVLAALAVLLTGWVPRLSALAWLGVVVAFVVGWLGSVLDLPETVRGLSPYHYLPEVPVEDVNTTPLVVLTLLAAALTAAGVAGFRRRDLTG